MERARRNMAVGRLDAASRLIQSGQTLYPASSALADLKLSLERASAHSTIRRLEVRIDEDGDPRAFEELIKLYEDLELPDQARRRAEAYVERHPERDAPHLFLGRLYLEAFFEELRARHGHRAHEHLVRAAALNAMSIQPRMLLAELYFCVGAPHALKRMMTTLRQLAPGQDGVTAAALVADRMDAPEREDPLDGTFERAEFNGHLERAPEDWPLSKRPHRLRRGAEEATDATVQDLIASGVVDELVLLRRDGTVVTHATLTGVRREAQESPVGVTGNGGLVDVVRTVAGQVFPLAREFDLGKFKRCVIRGRFGHVVIGRLGTSLGGVRGSVAAEPLRMWERVALELEGSAGGASR